MARIRSIKPETFSSYSLASVPIEVRYLFIGLWCESDDYGRMIDSPKRIAGAVFPHDEKVTEVRVVKWLDELERIGCIQRYTAGQAKYLCIPSWEVHQKISHKGEERIPKPSGDPPELFRSDTGEIPEPLRPDLGPRIIGSRIIGSRKGSDDPEFILWYETYPLHQAVGKAREAYPKARAKVDADTLLAGAKRYRDDPNRDPAYTKLPATWLNQECWADEAMPVRSSTKEVREWFEP